MDALTDLHMCVLTLCMLCKYPYRRMTHTNRRLTHVHVRRGRISVLRRTLAGLEPAIFGSENQHLIQ